MEEILKYFPELTDNQINQFSKLGPLYQDWNSKINVISRKDIDNLYTHHVLHSMAIAKWISFLPQSKVIDLGAGGGFPSIPLAILYPDVQFICVDSIRKKLKVIDEIAKTIELKNIGTIHSRVEDIKEKADFVVCRAVAKLEKLVKWTERSFSSRQRHAVPNGLIALKGGRVKEEIKAIEEPERVEITNLTTYFDNEYFDEKHLLYCPA